MSIVIQDFVIKGDDRGSLIALESMKTVPFEIKRVYYIFDTKENVRRGKHAHLNLEQLLVCVTGKCKILLDDGKKKTIIELNKPNQGIYIKGLIWREMYDFSNDCVLMVLASELYNENDYIYNYEEFVNISKG